MEEKILEILNDINPDIDYMSETELIDGGILDSFDIVSLVNDLKSTFDVNITVVDLIPENFNSVQAMVNLITKLSTGGSAR